MMFEHSWAVLGVLLVALLGSAGHAGPTDEPHLSIVPRTAEEARRIEDVTAPTTDFSKPQKFEENAGGAATVRARSTSEAFSIPSGNMAFERELDFQVGNGIFGKLWVSSPSSTLASDGLGPLYNARSCQRCHIKDGRGRALIGPDEMSDSFLMRVTIPAGDTDVKTQITEYLERLPDPAYGGQIQGHSLAGHPGEATVTVKYTGVDVSLAGGEVVTLQKPAYALEELGYGPLHTEAGLSPRVAPQMIGLGLLEAVPAADILASVDSEDADGDGISGRANVVWSAQFERPMLGRFGLKAGKVSLREQSAAAFSGDMGISSSLHPAAYGDCTKAQDQCREAEHGDRDDRVFEVDDLSLDFVTFYARNLAVPKRRDVGDVQVLRGKELFYGANCTGCHRPSYVTHRLVNQPEQSFQLIWPYTDMLLHDMGDGLADDVPEGRATGREWRTPPLWGIGLTEQVSGHTTFLHDGRARSLMEAILWHGGEAEEAKEHVMQMPPSDRAALIKFLESL